MLLENNLVWSLRINTNEFILCDGSSPIINGLECIKTWGEISQSLSSSVNEVQSSEVSITLITYGFASLRSFLLSESADSAIYEIYAKTDIEEKSVFSGFLREYSESDGVGTLLIQDGSIYLEDTTIGTKITKDEFPKASEPSIGKIVPILIGSAEKVPSVCIKDGKILTILGSENLPGPQDSAYSKTCSILVNNVDGIIPGDSFYNSSELVTVVSVLDEEKVLSVLRGSNPVRADIGSVLIENTELEFALIDCDVSSSDITNIYAKYQEMFFDISEYAMISQSMIGGYNVFTAIVPKPVEVYNYLQSEYKKRVSSAIRSARGATVSSLSKKEFELVQVYTGTEVSVSGTTYPYEKDQLLHYTITSDSEIQSRFGLPVRYRLIVSAYTGDLEYMTFSDKTVGSVSAGSYSSINYTSPDRDVDSWDEFFSLVGLNIYGGSHLSEGQSYVMPQIFKIAYEVDYIPLPEEDGDSEEFISPKLAQVRRTLPGAQIFVPASVESTILYDITEEGSSSTTIPRTSAYVQVCATAGSLGVLDGGYSMRFDSGAIDWSQFRDKDIVSFKIFESGVIKPQKGISTKVIFGDRDWLGITTGLPEKDRSYLKVHSDSINGFRLDGSSSEEYDTLEYSLLSNTQNMYTKIQYKRKSKLFNFSTIEDISEKLNGFTHCDVSASVTEYGVNLSASLQVRNITISFLVRDKAKSLAFGDSLSSLLGDGVYSDSIDNTSTLEKIVSSSLRNTVLTTGTISIHDGFSISGALLDSSSVQDILVSICKQLGAYYYYDKKSINIGNILSEAWEYEEIPEVYITNSGVPSVITKKTVFSDLCNRREVKYGAEYSTGSEDLKNSFFSENSESISIYGKKENDSAETFPLVRSENQAKTLASLYLSETAFRRWLTTLEIPSTSLGLVARKIVFGEYIPHSQVTEVAYAPGEADIDVIKLTAKSVTREYGFLDNPGGSPAPRIYAFEIPSDSAKIKVAVAVDYGSVSYGSIILKHNDEVINSNAPRAIIGDVSAFSLDTGTSTFNGITNFSVSTSKFSEFSDILSINGESSCIICDASGRIRIDSYTNALKTSQESRRLLRMLEGRNGTESVQITAPEVVILLSSCSIVELALDEIGKTHEFSVSLSGFESFSNTSTTQISGIGLKPYAPAHFRSSPQNSGDFRLSWVRRDRKNVVWFNNAELSEVSESYKVEIVDANSSIVKRTISSTENETLYAVSQFAEDFPVPEIGQVLARVYQLSSVVGRGSYSEIVIY